MTGSSRLDEPSSCRVPPREQIVPRPSVSVPYRECGDTDGERSIEEPALPIPPRVRRVPHGEQEAEEGECLLRDGECSVKGRSGEQAGREKLPKVLSAAARLAQYLGRQAIKVLLICGDDNAFDAACHLCTLESLSPRNGSSARRRSQSDGKEILRL